MTAPIRDMDPRASSPLGEARHAMLLLILGCAVLALSSIAPRNRITWFIEVAPLFVVGPWLLLTWHRFRLSLLAYQLLFVLAFVLIVGAHYTYSMVPPGDWLQTKLGFQRNHFDRLAQFTAGAVTAILVRELLMRRTGLRPGVALFLLACAAALSASALHELAEWLSARQLGSRAEAFIGAQGDPWDTQWDLTWALIGAIAAQLLIARWHERQVQRLRERETLLSDPPQAPLAADQAG